MPRAQTIQPVTMRIQCPHCAAALDLVVADWTPDIYAERSKTDYACPACQTRHTVILPGHVLEVTRHV